MSDVSVSDVQVSVVSDRMSDAMCLRLDCDVSDVLLVSITTVTA